MNIKKIFIKIKNNHNAQTVVKNFAYLSILQFASYLLPLITLPYLARVIGPSGFGKIAFASAVITWFISVVTWGFDFTATRDVARVRDDKDAVSEIFTNIFWARLFLSIICFLTLVFLIIFIPIFRESSIVLLVTFLLIPGRVMFPEWMFQALERMKFITILRISSQLFFSISVFIFIKTPQDYILQPLLISLGQLVSGAIAMYLIIVKWSYKINKPCIKNMLLTIKDGVDIFINNFAPNLYNSFSTVLLGMYYGEVANGLFSAGGKLITIVQQFVGVLSRSFFPFLSRKIDKHNIYALITLSTTFICSIILFIFAPQFIQLLYSSEFENAVVILRILAFSVFFMSLTNVYGVNFLILKGQEKLLRNVTLKNSVIGMFVAFPLIYFYSYWGAAITVMLTRMFVGISITYKAFKLKNNEIVE